MGRIWWTGDDQVISSRAHHAPWNDMVRYRAVSLLLAPSQPKKEMGTWMNRIKRKAQETGNQTNNKKKKKKKEKRKRGRESKYPWRACARLSKLLDVAPNEWNARAPVNALASACVDATYLVSCCCWWWRRLLFLCSTSTSTDASEGTFSISHIPIRRLALTRVQPTNYTVFRVWQAGRSSATCRHTTAAAFHIVTRLQDPTWCATTRDNTQQVNIGQEKVTPQKHSCRLHFISTSRSTTIPSALTRIKRRLIKIHLQCPNPVFNLVATARQQIYTCQLVTWQYSRAQQ